MSRDEFLVFTGLKFIKAYRISFSHLTKTFFHISSYVEDLISQLEQKGRLEHKYKQLEILANKKQKELSEQIVQWQDQYELLCDSARQLQGEVSKEVLKIQKM